MAAAQILAYLHRRWGITRFVFIALIAVFFVEIFKAHSEIYRSLVTHPSARLVLLFSYLIVFLLCFASYERIFKFKVFLLGHLFLATGLLFWYLNYRVYPYPEGWYTFAFLKRVDYLTSLRVLVAFKAISLLIVSIAPLALRYRMTRLIALFLFFMVPAIFFLVMYHSGGAGAASILLYGRGYLAALYSLNLLVIAITLVVAVEENSFGGAIAGLAVINLLMAHHINLANLYVLKSLIFLEPLLMAGGVLFYWLSCLHRRVAYDPLLQVYNRDYAFTIINETARVSLGSPFCIAMVDIDKFKKINDAYGHPAGDEVLFRSAQSIRKSALPAGITCRYGGEEIIIFMRGHTEEDGYFVAEKIRRNIKKIHYQAGSRKFSVTVSIGFAECDDPSVPIERVVRAADEAVYQAKALGRDRVVVGRIQKRSGSNKRKTYIQIVASGKDRRKPTKRRTKK